MEEAMMEMAKQIPAAFALIVVIWMFLKDRSRESEHHTSASEQRRAIAEKQETARGETAEKQETARLETLFRIGESQHDHQVAMNERFSATIEKATKVINENTKVLGATQELLRATQESLRRD